MAILMKFKVPQKTWSGSVSLQSENLLSLYPLTCLTKLPLVVDCALAKVSACANVQTANTAILTNGWRTRPIQACLFSCVKKKWKYFFCNGYRRFSQLPPHLLKWITVFATTPTAIDSWWAEIIFLSKIFFLRLRTCIHPTCVGQDSKLFSSEFELPESWLGLVNFMREQLIGQLTSDVVIPLVNAAPLVSFLPNWKSSSFSTDESQHDHSLLILKLPNSSSVYLNTGKSPTLCLL